MEKVFNIETLYTSKYIFQFTPYIVLKIKELKDGYFKVTCFELELSLVITEDKMITELVNELLKIKSKRVKINIRGR